jgi:xanthine dehydrogenase accessory factor
MYSTDLEVFSHLLLWLEQGRRVALVTVVNTWGASPRPVSAVLGMRDDGSLIGSVSGGCVEDDLADKMRQGQFTKPTVLTYGVTTEKSQQVGLLCGGRIELVVEPLNGTEVIRPVVNALEQRQLIARQLDLNTAAVEWQTVNTEQTLRYDGQILSTVYGPAWQLLIIGAGQTSRYVSEFANALNYQVILCDPRREYAVDWQTDNCYLDHQMPDEAVNAWVKDRRSAVITLTHDPKLDDMALLEALNSPAFYVGALGSKLTAEKRRKRLKEMGISESALARLHAPVGLPIGSRSPPEIAIAILAEITSVKNC